MSVPRHLGFLRHHGDDSTPNAVAAQIVEDALEAEPARWEEGGERPPLDGAAVMERVAKVSGGIRPKLARAPRVPRAR
eukprot:6900897-Prymnesium_polylepis.1